MNVGFMPSIPSDLLSLFALIAASTSSIDISSFSSSSTCVQVGICDRGVKIERGLFISIGTKGI